ncbi:carbohydrate kinase [Methylicorpusculum oleiharenae]|uniref:carbohydrate kinase family protein n=1 Tax=Methylicorpusculum oleiharenae TaxID=1338687 RepID=UPI001358C23E|nr:carbohydrate kinase [Methylicorpusculum oleiharenae]MCD2452690.1 carbohydrate kinase [Methylicorpusculum oleiharenae]
MNNNKPLHIFGEVLFDHFPDGSRVLGGAPFNVAWHLQAFGLSPRFISRIGDDPSGQEVAALMDFWGMHKEALQRDPEHPTGSVRVSIDNGEPHYEIIPDCAYDFIDSQLLDEKTTQGILYHGSLALRNLPSYRALQTTKARHQGKIFVDVNLRVPWWDRDLVLSLLHDADWVKLNEAELAELCSEESSLENAMRACCAQFNLDMLVVTRGPKGAVACDRRQDFVSVEPPKSMPVVDTVGAGDAFAAVLLMGLSKQWSMDLMLDRAQAFASNLVGRRGATVTDSTFYSVFNEQWH